MFFHFAHMQKKSGFRGSKDRQNCTPKDPYTAAGSCGSYQSNFHVILLRIQGIEKKLKSILVSQMLEFQN